MVFQFGIQKVTKFCGEFHEMKRQAQPRHFRLNFKLKIYLNSWKIDASGI